jgi:hypothetical protein
MHLKSDAQTILSRLRSVDSPRNTGATDQFMDSGMSAGKVSDRSR